MGMYDYIKCQMPLPKTKVQPNEELFQTKDTPDQYLTIYTIKKNGKLYWNPYTIKSIPKKERPYPDDNGIKGIFGCMKRIESPEEVVPDFHKDLFFYTYSKINKNKYWWEYKARFTNGVCEKIELIKFEEKVAEK